MTWDEWIADMHSINSENWIPNTSSWNNNTWGTYIPPDSPYLMYSQNPQNITIASFDDPSPLTEPELNTNDLNDLLDGR